MPNELSWVPLNWMKAPQPKGRSGHLMLSRGPVRVVLRPFRIRIRSKSCTQKQMGSQSSTRGQVSRMFQTTRSIQHPLLLNTDTTQHMANQTLVKCGTIAKDGSGLVEKRYASLLNSRVNSVKCFSVWGQIWQMKKFKGHRHLLTHNWDPCPGPRQSWSPGERSQCRPLCWLEGSPPKPPLQQSPRDTNKSNMNKSHLPEPTISREHWHACTWKGQ